MFSVLPPNVLSNGPTIWYWAHYSNNFMNEQNDTVVCAVSRYGISLKFYNSFLLIDLIIVISCGIGYTVVNLSRSNLGSGFHRWFKVVNDFKYVSNQNKPKSGGVAISIRTPVRKCRVPEKMSKITDRESTVQKNDAVAKVTPLSSPFKWLFQNEECFFFFPVACVEWRFCRARYWAAKPRVFRSSRPNLLAVHCPCTPSSTLACLHARPNHQSLLSVDACNSRAGIPIPYLSSRVPI